MTFISPQDQQTLRTLFSQELQNDVTLLYFTQLESVMQVRGQECTICKDTRELLEEVTGLSEKIHLTVKDFVQDEPEAQRLGVTHIPATILQGSAKGAVRFFGVPAGYEFSTLIEDILDISKGTTKLHSTTQEAVSKIDQDLHIQVFVTPT